MAVPDPQCPRCTSETVHRSRRRNLRDRVMAFFSKRPYRCEECDLRFYWRFLPCE
jgi:transposase-like protein